MINYETMNPEVKTKWVNELKSGKYGQTRERLKSEKGNYCSLGVLCQLYINEGLDTTENTDKFLRNDAQMLVAHYGSIGIPPYEVAEWAGFARTGLCNELSDEELKLVMLNDNNKRSFKYIANWINNNL